MKGGRPLVVEVELELRRVATTTAEKETDGGIHLNTQALERNVRAVRDIIESATCKKGTKFR